MSDEMPNFKGLTDAVLNTGSPLVEGAEALRRATDTAYWGIEALGSKLMDYSSRS